MLLNYKAPFGESLKACIKNRGMTIFDAAINVGVGNGTIEKWLYCGAFPREKNWPSVVHAFPELGPYFGIVTNEDGVQVPPKEAIEPSKRAANQPKGDAMRDAMRSAMCLAAMARNPAAKRTFGQDLRFYRERSGRSIRDLAHVARASENDIRAWEQDQAKMPRRIFSRVVLAFPEMKEWRNSHDAFQPEVEHSAEEQPDDETVPSADAAQITFGKALYSAREKQGVKRHTIAELCGVTYKTVKLWERDQNVPVRENYDKLLGIFSELKDAPQPKWQDRPKPTGGGTTTEPAVAKPEIPQVVRRSAAFGDALRSVRIASGMSQKDVADLVGVTDNAVHGWETNEYSPVRENYEKIIELFPSLKYEPEPDWRNIQKPVGRSGHDRIAPDISQDTTQDPMSSSPIYQARTQVVSSSPDAPSPADWIELLCRVRAVEATGASNTIAMLTEAQKLGVSVGDLLRMLAPKP